MFTANASYGYICNSKFRCRIKGRGTALCLEVEMQRHWLFLRELFGIVKLNSCSLVTWSTWTGKCTGVLTLNPAHILQESRVVTSDQRQKHRSLLVYCCCSLESHWKKVFVFSFATPGNCQHDPYFNLDGVPDARLRSVCKYPSGCWGPCGQPGALPCVCWMTL